MMNSTTEATVAGGIKWYHGDLYKSNMVWYQAAIWRASMQGLIQAPSATGFGWVVNAGTLRVKWMTQQPAPKEVLEVMFCRCK
jgi:hypothetical protein